MLPTGRIVEKSNGLYKHIGLELDNGSVLHTAPNKNICVETLAAFGEGSKIKITTLNSIEQMRLTERFTDVLNSPVSYD